jgi:DNA-binding response OmpR family regulator
MAGGTDGGDFSAAAATTSPGISVDVVMRAVTVDGRPVELTPKEYDLLVLLVQNPGRPFNRGELLDRVWRNDYEVTERTVDACVVRLRRKLGERAKAIQTVWGVGYRYQRDDQGPA